MENQTQVFHPFHRPLKIPQKRRDFHIPTAPARTAWKSGKPKPGFPLSQPARAMTMTVPLSKPRKPTKGGRPLRGLRHSPIPRSLRSSGADFMLIFQLENAKPMTATEDGGRWRHG
jgi:hypothetical protein